jgi:predicted nucleic acid-binding protein
MERDQFQGRILDIDRLVAEIWGLIMARGAAAPFGFRPSTY